MSNEIVTLLRSAANAANGPHRKAVEPAPASPGKVIAFPLHRARAPGKPRPGMTPPRPTPPVLPPEPPPPSVDEQLRVANAKVSDALYELEVAAAKLVREGELRKAMVPRRRKGADPHGVERLRCFADLCRDEWHLFRPLLSMRLDDLYAAEHAARSLDSLHREVAATPAPAPRHLRLVSSSSAAPRLLGRPVDSTLPTRR